jgi:cell division protein FtsB
VTENAWVTSRPRQSSAPGSGRGRAGSRPSSTAANSRTTRSTSRSLAGEAESSAPGGSARSKLTGRAAVLVLVLAVLAVSYASSTRAWLRQRGELNQLNAEIAAQRAQVAELEQAKRRLHDPAYIKEQARARFGWVMPGETGYRVIGDDGEVITDSSSALSEPVDSSADLPSQWWDTAWGSVVAAGDEKDDATADDASVRTTDQPAGHIDRGGSDGRAGGGGNGGSGLRTNGGSGDATGGR